MKVDVQGYDERPAQLIQTRNSSGFSREEMVQITIEESKAPCCKVMMGATQPTHNAGWGTYLILHRMISAFIIEHG